MTQLNYLLKSSKVKRREHILPYVTFPLLNICDNQCIFCGEGGELTEAGQGRFFDIGTLIDRTLSAMQMGISKFRLTGGEPFLHPKIAEILKFFSDKKIYTLVNTNGGHILRKRAAFTELNDNVHVAVSLHTTDEEAYNKITGSRAQFRKVFDGIHYLAETGNLLRLNMVVTKYNKDNLDSMIALCKSFGCGLKIHEIVDVPKPFGEREDFLVPILPIEHQIAAKAERVITHEYSQSFGIPCNRYVVDGVTINVKSLGHGTRFDLESLCKDCKHMPCHEGLYDCYVLPDGNVLPCRWGAKFYVGMPFKEQFAKAIEIFQNSDYHLRTASTRSCETGRFFRNLK